MRLHKNFTSICTICGFFFIQQVTSAKGATAEDCKNAPSGQTKVEVCSELIDSLRQDSSSELASIELSNLIELTNAYRERAIGFHEIAFNALSKDKLTFKKMMSFSILDLSIVVLFDKEFKMRFPDEAVSKEGMASDLTIRGSFLMSINEFENALTDFNLAVELDPQYATGWNNRSYALERLGRTKEAKLSYERTYEIAPSLNPKSWQKKKK